MNEIIKTSREEPLKNLDEEYRFDSFKNNEVFSYKKLGRLPAMGWNSWNAFGSQNTEELTKAMADKIIELGLDKLGYKYVVLDDGCYKSERIAGRLSNEDIKFPGGFKALSDYVHDKGLKFGMYNDIGSNLCAGAAVGTCGFEDVDAKSYIEWGVDFLKVDNCYYLWDNATFSNAENARYTYAPNIKSIKVFNEAFSRELDAVKDGVIYGNGAYVHENGYISNIGTYDGTNVGTSPVGEQSSELIFKVNVPADGKYIIVVNYATGKQPGIGEWLQLSVGRDNKEKRYFDGILSETCDSESFESSKEITVYLASGDNEIRIMNHRRQENVLVAYSAMYFALKRALKDSDVVLSICEWGKTQPQNWGYKVGDSWRILNDITFQVGAVGNNGKASWKDIGTPSITSQYDKAVVMDEFAGLNKGWNDPDMLVIGMDGITPVMAKTHMTMWCMMNSPLMLGMDLRRVSIGDDIYNVIANKDIIDLNQDSLGIQAKRIFSTITDGAPDLEYITNHERVDILAKPLSNGDVAVSFINLSDENSVLGISTDINRIVSYIGNKIVNAQAFVNSTSYKVTDLWSKESYISEDGSFAVKKLCPCDSYTIRISPQV